MNPIAKTPLFGALGVFFALGSLLISAPARAQDIATAEALFNRGVEDMKAGRYETGCVAIAESQRLDPRPGTLFTLATCEAEWGRLATAVTRYGDYLLLYDRLPDDRKATQGERPNVAKAQRDKLGPDVPQLTLSLPAGAPAGTIVRRDGEVVSELVLGVALPVDPGEHVVSIQVPGGRVSEQRITIARGEKKVVTLAPEVKTAAKSVGPVAVKRGPVPGSEPPPAALGQGASRSYVGPIVAFGVGAAGLAAGVGLGVTVLGQRAELDKVCPGSICPPSEQGRLDSAKALAHGSTAGFVVAGVGAAAGVVMLVLPAPGADEAKKVGVRLGAGYVGVEGVF